MMAVINTPTPVHHVQQSLELNGQSIWAESQCFILKWTLFSDFTQQSQFIVLYFLKLQLSFEIWSFWSLCYSEHSDSLCTISWSESSPLKIFSTNSWENNLTYDLLKTRLDLILKLWVRTCYNRQLWTQYLRFYLNLNG